MTANDTLSPLRHNLLRVPYAILVIGLGIFIWPTILDVSQPLELSRGVTLSMLGALSALSLLGLRYPVKMLPLLFFELGWKLIWLLSVALPHWTGGTMDDAMAQTAIECLAVAIFIPFMPWYYVWRSYVTAPGEPWQREANYG